MTDLDTLRPGLLALLAAGRPAGSTIEVGAITPLTGGYNQLMATVAANVDGVPQTVVLRCDPPAGQAVVETDRGLEIAVLQALATVDGARAPHVIAADPDGAYLGRPALVMEYIPGGSLLARVRKAAADALPGHATDFCDLIADVHAIPLAALPPQLEQPESWDGYVDAVIARWRQVEATHAENDPFVRYVAAWLELNKPAPVPLTLVHGELQPSNIVGGEDRPIVAVDWELVHVGDPREDLGWAMSLEQVQPPTLIGADPAAFCAHYRGRTGLSEAQVNPATMGWFAILSAVGAFGGASIQQKKLANGEASSAVTAFITGWVATMHEAWLGGTRQLEQAALATQGQVPA